MRGVVIAAIAGLAVACSRSEPDPTSDVPVASPSAQATSVATTPTVGGPVPTATPLGAVSLPDAKACVSECSERRKAEAISADAIEAACRAQCAKECLEHCKQKRSGMPDFETVCARDCGVQQQLLR